MPRIKTPRAFLCTALMAMLATLVQPSLLFAQNAPTGASVGSTPGPEAPSALAGETARQQLDKHPKLDSHLAATLRAHRERGAAAAVAEARSRDVRVDNAAVTVVVEAEPSGSVASAVARAGGRIEASSGHLVRASVPIAALDALALDGAVRLRPPPVEADGGRDDRARAGGDRRQRLAGRRI